jgi:hypothetical protein
MTVIQAAEASSLSSPVIPGDPLTVRKAYPGTDPKNRFISER